MVKWNFRTWFSHSSTLQFVFVSLTYFRVKFFFSFNFVHMFLRHTLIYGIIMVDSMMVRIPKLWHIYASQPVWSYFPGMLCTVYAKCILWSGVQIIQFYTHLSKEHYSRRSVHCFQGCPIQSHRIVNYFHQGNLHPKSKQSSSSVHPNSGFLVPGFPGFLLPTNPTHARIGAQLSAEDKKRGCHNSSFNMYTCPQIDITPTPLSTL